MDGRCIHHLRYSLQSASGTISDLKIIMLILAYESKEEPFLSSSPLNLKYYPHHIRKGLLCNNILTIRIFTVNSFLQFLDMHFQRNFIIDVQNPSQFCQFILSLVPFSLYLFYIYFSICKFS